MTGNSDIKLGIFTCDICVMQDPTPNLRQSAALRSLKSNCPLLAHSCWNAIPAALGLAHCAAVMALVVAFHTLNWPAFLAFAFLYAISISWSINSIAHNFIHNPYFVSHALNRAFSVLLSMTIGFSQAIYHYVHLWHHAGMNNGHHAEHHFCPKVWTQMVTLHWAIAAEQKAAGVRVINRAHALGFLVRSLPAP